MTAYLERTKYPPYFQGTGRPGLKDAPRGPKIGSMSAPYRTAGDAPDDGTEASGPIPLGALVSVHHRTSVIGGWPEVDIHENGILVHQAKRGTVALPFEEIDAIHYDYEGLVPGPPRITLVGFDGVRTALPNDLQALDRFLAVLDREVTHPIIAQAKEALSGGERMVFGPVVVELDGIVLNGQSLTWEHLSRVDAERDAFVFFAREPLGCFGRVRVREVPHPLALVEVLRLRTTVVARGLALLG